MQQANSQVIAQVNGLIDKRLGQLRQVQRILTHGKSSTELVLKSFIDEITGFVSILTSSDANILANNIEQIHTQTLADIPLDSLNSITAASVMHNKFKALTAAVLNSDYLPEFFRGVVSLGCENISDTGSAAVSEINNIRDGINSHIGEIAEYLSATENDKDKDLINKILNNGPDLIVKCEDMYLKIISLTNTIKRTNNFSANSANNILSLAESIISGFGTENSKNPAMATANIRNYLNAFSEIEYKINAMKAYGSDLQNFKNAFMNLDLNKIMQDSFSKVLNSGNRVIYYAKTAVDAAKSGNALTLIQAVNAIISQVSYTKGLVGQMSKQKLKQAVPVLSAIEADFEALRATADYFVNSFPDEAMRILKGDINTIVKATESLAVNAALTNLGARPAIGDILTIGARIAQKSGEVTTHILELLTAVKSFTPTKSEAALNAIDALKKTAPTPLEAMSKGNMLTFTRSLDNPMLLTKIGECQQAINDAMKDPNITTLELGMLTTLLDFVNGEHNREIMDMFVSDQDLQKSIAVQSLELYINETLEPHKRLLDEYKKISSERKGV